jgi:hypothetical protein
LGFVVRMPFHLPGYAPDSRNDSSTRFITIELLRVKTSHGYP